jgi:Xaa-Pro aminopeptidase
VAESSSKFKGRLQKLRGLLEDLSAPAAILFDPANILYMTGYWTILSPSNPSALVFDSERAVLIIPGLEYEWAKQLNLDGVQLAIYRNYPLRIKSSTEPIRLFSSVLDQVVETMPHLPSATELEIARGPVVERVKLWARGVSQDIGPTLRLMRAEKDEDEIRSIRSAAQIASSAVVEMLAGVGEGVSETDLAARIAAAIWRLGGRATHIVVGSGPRSAFAHPLPTTRLLCSGELVLIDIGVLYDGYWAEIARTVAVGAPTDKQVEWHRVVVDAQRAAAGALRAGSSGGEIDSVARERIASAGFDGTVFNHALGHGVGLLGMDLPMIAPGHVA